MINKVQFLLIIPIYAKASKYPKKSNFP